jgi:hypothetical protein
MAHPTLVTGAAGRVGGIGGRVTELLLRRGKAVRAMVRNEDERAQALRDMGAKVVVGNLLDLDSMHEVIDGCETMYFGMSVSADYLAAPEVEMGDREIRTALERHWAASDVNDFAVEHEIYREDAVLHYPQSGERIRGRHNIQESRTLQPSEKRFAVQRIIGNGDLWCTEFVLSYDGVPSYAVSIMEFIEGKVARETQYFGDPFEPGPSRAHLVEPND